MTYLFLLIGIAVINALSNKKTSYSELVFTNAMLFAFPFMLEKLPVRKRMAKQSIVYDQLKLLNPTRRQDLLADINERIGIKAELVKIRKIDLTKGVALITAYYHSAKNEVPDEESGKDEEVRWGYLEED